MRALVKGNNEGVGVNVGYSSRGECSLHFPLDEPGQKIRGVCLNWC
jgi:hypothetical protein